LAYLNFYTALSHDTLAREATLKNRYRELNLAEKHYMAAISALTPSQTSSLSSSEFIWKFRQPSHTSSIDSTSSYGSSSSGCSDLDYTHHGLGSFSFPQPPSQTHHKTRPSTTLTNYSNTTSMSNKSNNLVIPSRPQTPEEYQFAADTSAFISMVRGHLSNVKDLKHRSSVPAVHFTFPAAPQWSSSSPARMSRGLYEGGEVGETKRRERVNRTFRPRFDPEEVQRLCGEALAELNY
jgi:hypothetical protein